MAPGPLNPIPVCVCAWAAVDWSGLSQILVCRSYLVRTFDPEKTCALQEQCSLVLGLLDMWFGNSESPNPKDGKQDSAVARLRLAPHRHCIFWPWLKQARITGNVRILKCYYSRVLETPAKHQGS